MIVFNFCSAPNKDENANNLLVMAIVGTPGLSSPTNLAVSSTSARSATLTWDKIPNAIVYRVYYTSSISTPSIDSSGNLTQILSATDPSVVPESTSEITRLNNVDTPLVLSNLKLGIPYKFIVTAVSGTGESLASSIVSIAEVIPTQVQRQRGIWTVGGLQDSYTSAVSAVDLYDPDTSTWFSGLTSLPTPVSFAGIAGVRNSLIIAGGFTSSGSVSGLTQVYDVLADKWSNKLQGPASLRANMSASAVNGKVFFLGGTTTSNTSAWAGSTATDIYDVANNTWSTGLAFGATGSGRASTIVGNVVYNNGGRTAAAVVGTTHDGYMIASNALTTGNIEVVLSTGRTGHSLVSYTNSVLSEMWSIGGVTAITGVLSSGIASGTITAYTPTTLVQALSNPFSAGATWTTNPPQLTSAMGFGSAVVDPRNGNVYYSGGNSNSALPTSPAGNTMFIKSNFVTKEPWVSLTNLPTKRWGHQILILQ